MKVRKIAIVLGIVVVVAGVAALVAPAVLSKTNLLSSGGSAANNASITTATVTTVTAVSSVDSSGAVNPEQTASLSLKTDGAVQTVAVKVGDHVKAGDALMTIDPASAPASVIQAQSDLASAKTALDDLLHPSETSIASAQKAVVDDQAAVDTAQRTLRNTQNPAGQSLYDTVASKKLALDTAQANAQLATVSQSVQDYTGQYWLTDYYWKRYQDLQAKYNAAPNPDSLTKVNNAYADWKQLADQQSTRQLTFNTDQANKNAAVTSAQKDYNDAVANLNAAVKGPDATKLAQAKADLAVAQRTLADDQDKLNHLQNGAKQDDILAAQVKVQVAQAAVDSLTLRAPFDGDVLDVNYKPGDPASASQVAITLADRSRLHVDASVDESSIGAVAAGNPVTITLDALPGVTLTGHVVSIQPYGQTVQGLVRYTVRVGLDQTNPKLLLYMTANTTIVTNVDPNALAVPLAAIQYDNQGEYVNRVGAGSSLERVNVTSGQSVGSLVVVKGNLKPGDNVELVASKSSTPSGGLGG